MLHSGATVQLSALPIDAHAQTAPEPDDHFDARIADAALDAAQISADDVSFFG